MQCTIYAICYCTLFDCKGEKYASYSELNTPHNRMKIPGMDYAINPKMQCVQEVVGPFLTMGLVKYIKDHWHSFNDNSTF